MPYILNQAVDTGSFVPTTNVWDVSQIYEVEIGSPEFRELLVRLYQNINNIALVLNTKTTSYYLNQEFNTSNQFFNPADATQNPLNLKPSYRIAVNTGAFGAGVTTVAHGLAVNASWKWISILGAATDSVHLLGYPITFGGAAGNSIEVYVDATNININNQSGVTFTSSVVVLEYLKY